MGGRRILLLIGSLFAGGLAAQTPRPLACPSAEHRQFDFWIGDWEVIHAASGKLAGHNRIEAVQGACALREQYSTPGGYSGESLSIYDSRRGLWHQSWVDNGGLLLQIDGRWENGRMLLEGDGADAQGRPQRQRISWTPNADGTVRQLWEQQGADGRWTTAFDGLYRRRR